MEVACFTVVLCIFAKNGKYDECGRTIEKRRILHAQGVAGGRGGKARGRGSHRGGRRGGGESHLTETLRDVTAHAEMQAITAAADMLGGKYLRQCTLYVTVEPCVMCAGAIGWAQIGRIVYGASDEKRGYQIFAPRALHPKAVVTRGILEEECRRIVQDFFRERR